MSIQAIRGAITIPEDSKDAVMEATTTLLDAILERNNIASQDIISIFFTATSDIKSLAPAAAARDIGMVDVPLLCAQEMFVEDSLALCIRTFLHINTPLAKSELQHVFLSGATTLRPDLAQPGDAEV